MDVPMCENLNKIHLVKVFITIAHFYLTEQALRTITGPYPGQSENLYVVINEKRELLSVSLLYLTLINIEAIISKMQ